MRFKHSDLVYVTYYAFINGDAKYHKAIVIRPMLTHIVHVRLLESGKAETFSAHWLRHITPLEQLAEQAK